jgi:hypothetical protein
LSEWSVLSRRKHAVACGLIFFEHGRIVRGIVVRVGVEQPAIP